MWEDAYSRRGCDRPVTKKIKMKTKPVNSKSVDIGNGCQRTGIAAGGIFYKVQPGTAAQLKI